MCVRGSRSLEIQPLPDGLGFQWWATDCWTARTTAKPQGCLVPPRPHTCPSVTAHGLPGTQRDKGSAISLGVGFGRLNALVESPTRPLVPHEGVRSYTEGPALGDGCYAHASAGHLCAQQTHDIHTRRKWPVALRVDWGGYRRGARSSPPSRLRHRQVAGDALENIHQCVYMCVRGGGGCGSAPPPPFWVAPWQLRALCTPIAPPYSLLLNCASQCGGNSWRRACTQGLHGRNYDDEISCPGGGGGDWPLRDGDASLHERKSGWKQNGPHSGFHKNPQKWCCAENTDEHQN